MSKWSKRKKPGSCSFTLHRVSICLLFHSAHTNTLHVADAAWTWKVTEAHADDRESSETCEGSRAISAWKTMREIASVGSRINLLPVTFHKVHRYTGLQRLDVVTSGKKKLAWLCLSILCFKSSMLRHEIHHLQVRISNRMKAPVK